MSYVELHCHSGFSLLDGASNPETLIERAAAIGLTAIALTDHDDLGGAVRWAEAGREHGVEAIIGLELTIGDPGRPARTSRGLAEASTYGAQPGRPPAVRAQGRRAPTSARPPSADERKAAVAPSHLTLLAMSDAGYRNLSRLITLARSGDRGAPAVSWGDVERHADGLFCLTGCPFGEIPQCLARDDEAGARERLGWLAEVFTGNVAVECWDHALAAERALVPKLIGLAGSLDLPWLVTNDVHYATRRGRLVHDVLTCLRHAATLDTAGTLLRPNGEWYLKRPEKVAYHWRHYPEAIAATRDVAARCAFRMGHLAPALPSFPTPPGVTADRYLASLVVAGARERYPNLTARHKAQIRHELDVIRRLGLAGYFLIVWDIVREANRLGVLAQGRGSAANSAVCYCLGITAVDPIGMELLFERFLSEDRREAPDIDIDFAHRDREQVIQYVYRRYGRDHAAMVCEAITYRGRAAVRDAARVLGFSVPQAGKLADEADRDGARETGESLLEGGAKAAGLDPDDHRVRTLAEVVRDLHQLPRHRSIHVGGFVLSREPLADVVPIEPAAMPERTVIQWDKDDLDPVRLVKIDLLGLGMLTLIQDAVALIRAHRGVTIDLAKLPMDDAAVYDMLCRADTIGVFQVESRAQMNTLPRLAPRSFYDLVVEVALIRPGPIQGEMVHPYLRRRAGEEPIIYPHPSLEPILERTLGVPLFQEQGMQVAIAAAGFTPGEADELRRAMGHKRSHERMAKICAKLIEGMARNGIAPDVARRIFNQIAAFADYGFPESHAASFALLVYASAYLKLYYPTEFTGALLNAQPMGFYSPGTIVEDAKRHGVQVRSVDVMRSDWDCTVEEDDGDIRVTRGGSCAVRWGGDGGRRGGDGAAPQRALSGRSKALPRPDERKAAGALRIGLRYVRGLGAKARERLEPLLAGGRPASLEAWVRESGLNVAQLRALAEAGAFDALWPNRRSALWELLKHARGAAGPLTPVARDRRLAPVPPLAPTELTEADYRVTGLSPAGHPMRHLRAVVEARGALPAAALARRRDGDWVTVAGIVICRQRPGTAKGFCFVTLEDETGLANVVVAPKLFEANKRLIVRSPLLMVRGVLEEEQGVLNIRGRRFAALDPRAGAAFVTSHDFR
ncbi:MAG: error-prone DNA polymerase [Gemmatimonadetes bacterium]|nr:error-prone DNA polymerase [Gemmatimonadota bacterium]